MSASTAIPSTSCSTRPVVSEVQDTPLGRSFTVTFMPGQRLPTHANPSRIVISVVRGTGTIALVNDAPRQLSHGEFVQLEPNEPHAVTAGDDGLELLVTAIENCCGLC